MKFVSLFSGIGGLDLGLERAGMECVLQVEQDTFALDVLRHHWPNVAKLSDVCSVEPRHVAGADVIAGGFPCQDISFAGKGDGLDGERSGLWFEMLRICRENRPRYVCIENVSAILARGMADVLGGLAAIGYDAEWQTIQASDFGLPHRRRRVFIVAYPNGKHGQERLGNRSEAEVFSGSRVQCDAVHVQAAPSPDRVADGVSGGVYCGGVRGCGNAVAVPVAEWIGRQIMADAQRVEA